MEARWPPRSRRLRTLCEQAFIRKRAGLHRNGRAFVLLRSPLPHAIATPSGRPVRIGLIPNQGLEQFSGLGQARDRPDDKSGLLDRRVARQSSREPRPQGLPRKQPASHSGTEGSADNWSRPQLSARDQTQPCFLARGGPRLLAVAESARNRCDGSVRISPIEALTVTGDDSIPAPRPTKEDLRCTPFGLILERLARMMRIRAVVRPVV